ncbi:MAG: EAL domain-containing protein [Actinobacteria bacterium]|nr:EAL domain-containing protein [Actinomycetota bacterium]
MQAERAATSRRWWQAPPVRVWALTGAVSVVAVVLYFTTISFYTDPVARGFLVAPWVLVVLFVVAETFVVQLVFRREAYSFSLSEIPLVLGLFFATAPVLIAAHVVGAGGALVVKRRQRPVKLCFNVAQMTLSTGAAVAVFRLLEPGAGPVTMRAAAVTMVATLAGVVVSAACISAAIAAYDGRPRTETLAASVMANFLAGLTNTSLGLVGVVLLSSNSGSGWLLVVPAVVLLLAYRSITLGREKQEGLEFLNEASRVLHRGASLDEPMVALLTLARETFHAESAELVLVPEENDRRGLRTAVGPGAAVCSLEAVDLSTIELSAQPGADSMVATLDGESRRLGTIVVAGPSAAHGRFSRRQLQLFETFVNHVTMALENGLLETSLAELTALKEELRYQAFHDDLTGLGNRALFVNEVERVIAEAGPTEAVAVLFVDLDDFKTVNDTLGHAAGDELLMRTAERLRDCLRPGDVAVRLGGDEFAVLLGGMRPHHDAVAVAERLLAALREPVTVLGEDVHVGASVGVATARARGCSADDLLRKADVAMYTAKVRGKNRWEMFEPAMQQAVVARHAAKTQLQRAVDRGEFLVHYQPMVDMWTGEIVGAEALVRWWHPERGLLPPAEFVAAAEELGLIGAVGRFVLKTACTEARSWQRAFPRRRPIVVSVNVSAFEFRQADFVAQTVDAIRASGVAAGSVVLEITESAMVDGPTGAGDTLRALKAAGIRLAIDDFGTGYSSLSYLEELSIDILKIAKPFVDGLAADRNRPALAQAIVSLGETLDLEVIAEGVEGLDQVEALRAMGCRLSQGFALGRPVDAVEMRRLLAKGVVDVVDLVPTG